VETLLRGLLLFSEQALLKFTRDKIISELRKKGQTAILYELGKVHLLLIFGREEFSSPVGCVFISFYCHEFSSIYFLCWAPFFPSFPFSN